MASKKSNWLIDLFEAKETVTVPSKPEPPTQLEVYAGHYYDSTKAGGTKSTTDGGATDDKQISFGLSTDK